MTAHTDPPDARTGAVHDDERLPCGRLLSQVWDDWERQPADPTDTTDITGSADTHARTCPHCSRSVRELDELESAVRDLRDETTDAFSYDAATLTERVMDVVRLELRPGRPLPLEPAEDLWIMEAVAARALRTAAETVPGVRAGSCRLLPLTASGPTLGPVEVRLAVYAPAGVPLPELAEEVRDRVREAAEGRLGLETAAVHITVTDLIDTATDNQEGRTR